MGSIDDGVPARRHVVDQTLTQRADGVGYREASCGQVHDVVTAPALIDDVEGATLIADKAYDSNDF